MKRVFVAVFVTVFLAVVAVQGQEGGGGWVRLFDGKTLGQWTPVGNANWKVVNGEIWSTDGGGFLLSKQTYTNFEIRAEFWVTPDANSGIFIRCQDPAKVGAATCYEVNIFDTRPDQSYRTGGIVDVAKPASVINTGNKWNTLEITAKGPRLMVRMNGMQMVDVEDKKFARGPFALQAGVGVVRFKNVQIRELK
jgi:3-keto-disaccharide hydrolase